MLKNLILKKINERLDWEIAFYYNLLTMRESMSGERSDYFQGCIDSLERFKNHINDIK